MAPLESPKLAFLYYPSWNSYNFLLANLLLPELKDEVSIVTIEAIKPIPTLEMEQTIDGNGSEEEYALEKSKVVTDSTKNRQKTQDRTVKRPKLFNQRSFARIL